MQPHIYFIGVSTVAIATHLSVLLEVLCLYQTTLPSLTRSSPINVASILQGIKSVPLTEDTDAVLFVLALRLLADSDIQQIAWLKVMVYVISHYCLIVLQ